MNAFTLRLADAARTETVEGVTSFVGEDASGAFGIQAGHERFVTCLAFGLARFRAGEGPWTYLAVPGAVLRYADGVLTVSTRRYLTDPDFGRISAALGEVLLKEEEALGAVRDSLRRMEEAMLKRLWRLQRAGETLP